jgi:hypothetical protein
MADVQKSIVMAAKTLEKPPSGGFSVSGPSAIFAGLRIRTEVATRFKLQSVRAKTS